MKLRLVQLWETLRASYWFVPTLMAVSAALLAVLLFQVDQEARERYLPFLSDLYVMDAWGAQAILSTLASSAIMVAGVVFSIAMLVLSNASSQFGPRLLPNFMRQGGTQIVFGGFIATFIYAILVLTRVRSTDEGPEIPHLSVSMALVLGVFSFGLLIHFIHRVAMFIQAPNIVENVGTRLIDTFNRLFPDASSSDERSNAQEENQLPADFGKNTFPIPAPGNGYLEAIELGRVRDIADRHELVVHLLKRPGQFIIEGHVLALASPRDAVTEKIAAKIGKSFLLGPQRTLIQDAEFAVDQLVEVAVRALSPGINDPFTAITCIDWLGAALSFLAGRKLPSPLCCGADGRICVVTDPYTYEGILDAAFNQLRQHARTNEAVAIHLLDMIAVLAETELPEPYRKAMARHARLIFKDTLGNLPDASDRVDVEKRYEKVLQMLPDLGARAD